jgi:hypothetical protein
MNNIAYYDISKHQYQNWLDDSRYYEETIDSIASMELEAYYSIVNIFTVVVRVWSEVGMISTFLVDC